MNTDNTLLLAALIRRNQRLGVLGFGENAELSHAGHQIDDAIWRGQWQARHGLAPPPRS
jgi:hypothetical protein